MRERKIYLVCSIAILLLCSGTAWGQFLPKAQEIQHQHECDESCNHDENGAMSQPNEIDYNKAIVTIPVASPPILRSHPNMNDETNVSGSEIGAGESVTIGNGGVLTSVPFSNGGTLSGSVGSVMIGSVQDTNVVVRTYSGDGYGIGWISVLRVPSDGYSHVTGPDWTLANKYPFGKTYPDGNNVQKQMYFALTPQINSRDLVDVPSDAPSSWGATQEFSKSNVQIGGEYITGTPYYYGAGGSATANVGAKFQYAILYSFNSFNYEEFIGTNPWQVNRSGSNIAPCGQLLFNTTAVSVVSPDGSMQLRAGHHNNSNMLTTNASAITSPIGIYTTTIDRDYTHNRVPLSTRTPKVEANDRIYFVDEIPLVQFNGTAIVEAEALANQDTIKSVAGKGIANNVPPTPTTAGQYFLDNYQRPTNVAVEENNAFDDIIFNNLRWKFQNNFVDTTNSVVGLDAECNSGKFRAYGMGVKWYSEVMEGSTFLDASLQLIDGAVIQVRDSVWDNTSAGVGKIASIDSMALTPLTHQETNAMVIWPFSDRFTMRTLNYFQANIINERDKPTNSQIVYGRGDFPDPDAQVYLMPSTTGNKGSYSANNVLDGRDNGGAIVINPPYTDPQGSIFGIYGTYDFAGNMAQIHTLSELDGADPSSTTAPGAAGIMTGSLKGNSNQGVIEIGTGTPFGTLAQTGYNKFHVYSGGTLKNFESSAAGPSQNFAMNFSTSENTPNFYLDDASTLYVLNIGNNKATPATADYAAADINWHEDGIEKLQDAILNSIGSGALHIQAAGDIHFYDPFAPKIQDKDYPTELRILSDFGGIQLMAVDGFDYINTSDDDLVMWATGAEAGRRSCVNDTLTAGSGELYFKGLTSINQQGDGLTLLRSDHDDVFIVDDFTYINTTGTNRGEVIIQAGQDIYGSTDGGTKITFNQKGEKSILMEAKRTIHIEQDLTFDRKTAVAGDNTLKAGYGNFSTTADVISWDVIADYKDKINDLNDLTDGFYVSRESCETADGADIWLEGKVSIEMDADETIKTKIRAFNSVFFDNEVNFIRFNGDSALIYAETGNIEAIVGDGGKPLTFDLGDDDISDLIFQAGNKLGVDGINESPTQLNHWRKGSGDNAEFDGNILLNNPFNVTNTGIGNLLMSSARDIETQTGAPAIFDFNNSSATSGDILITGGRHVETHAFINFKYGKLDDDADVTVQAGRLRLSDLTGADDLCKTTELGTKLSDASNVVVDPMDGITMTLRQDNFFAAGGSGHGSILMFAPIVYDYKGKGTLLMTALNGNIESDPYLHGTYAGQDAALTFNHAGQGKVRMEAIDIKLHDRLYYEGVTHNNKLNGNLEIAAFDSILTRSVYYKNREDVGNVFITTEKMKRNPNDWDDILCEGSDYNSSPNRGIVHGNIVLGYGADCNNSNINDSIVFDFTNNQQTTGANVRILAGYDGFENNSVIKGYGGNITFDYMKADMALGNRMLGGSMEISTPNGNIWGKDSLTYNARRGDLKVDAGTGSVEDKDRQVRWQTGVTFPLDKGRGNEDMLNTNVPFACGDNGEWRTGNIMMKGGSLNFNTETGNATFRTREGFIDTYDAFTVENMQGTLLKYAGMDDLEQGRGNNWGDVSERDFKYTPITNSGSVFFGADDNIMLNYGDNNGKYPRYGYNTGDGHPGDYEIGAIGASSLYSQNNPFYNTPYEGFINGLCFAKYNVNVDGYMWYREKGYWASATHKMYRGGNGKSLSGDCETASNGARDLDFDFSLSSKGGLAVVATNYIDMFTKFNYFGGVGDGITGMSSLHGADVSGYGLYINSQFNGTGANTPEQRRMTCLGCGVSDSKPIQGRAAGAKATYDWTYIGFHDDARIHTHNQKAMLDAPVIEFFGHAELDAFTRRDINRTKLTLRADSLIFHDSVIFDGSGIELLPFTTGEQRTSDMRYGVINDDGPERANYAHYGPAITMEDRNLPVLELGYQRCILPKKFGFESPNANSIIGKEPTPYVGGEIIVAAKHDFGFPIFNTIVANHARITFLSDSLDHQDKGEYDDACLRTDLLRIRNNVEFYTYPFNSEPYKSITHRGDFKFVTKEQIESTSDPGMYMTHLHMEPNSELSLSGENSLLVIYGTTVGGYGNIHENVYVEPRGIVAPGYASLMESDCQTPHEAGILTMHNLSMEKDAVIRVSLGNKGVDAIHADSVFTWGIIPVEVLPTETYVEEKCHLFFIYDDLDGVTNQYLHNLKLVTDRYQDAFFSLDFNTPGKVYLCVTKKEMPTQKRRIDLPFVEGVITEPTAGTYYVDSQKDFSFTAMFVGDRLRVSGISYPSGTYTNLDPTSVNLGSNTYRYTLRFVQEEWLISIGPELSTVDMENVNGNKVWSYQNVLYVDTPGDDIVSIYTAAGLLYRRYEVSGGLNKYTLQRGVYMVKLKDGKAHTVIIK